MRVILKFNLIQKECHTVKKINSFWSKKCILNEPS